MTDSIAGENRYAAAMRRVFCCLIASVLSALAQISTDTDIAARLAKDLLPATAALTWPDPLRDDVYSRTELQSLATASLRGVMNAYEADLRELERRHNRVVRKPEEGSLSFRSFTSHDQSYKLARALVSKEITETTLLPVCEAIVHMVVASVECRNTSCHLQDAPDFRSAAENAWRTLHSIGLDGKDLRYVMDSFFRGAMAAAAPPARTIYK
jgi:hypothetical protein